MVSFGKGEMTGFSLKATIARRFMPAAVLLLLLPGLSAASEDLPLMKLEEVTDLIMSPGCNYTYTLTLCPSAEAAQMREIVKDKLQNGETKEEILAYFEGVYGPKVLARPARKGFYSLAWWFPYFLVADVFVLVGVILYVWRKRARGREAVEPGGSASPEEDDELFEDEVRRFKSR